MPNTSDQDSELAQYLASLSPKELQGYHIAKSSNRCFAIAICKSRFDMGKSFYNKFRYGYITLEKTRLNL